MKSNDGHTHVSRRGFLQTGGSLLAGSCIAGLSGILLRKRFTAREQAPVEKPCYTSLQTICAGCKKDCPLRKGVSI